LQPIVVIDGIDFAPPSPNSDNSALVGLTSMVPSTGNLFSGGTRTFALVAIRNKIESYNCQNQLHYFLLTGPLNLRWHMSMRVCRAIS
jgi:hypothetical protein